MADSVIRRTYRLPNGQEIRRRASPRPMASQQLKAPYVADTSASIGSLWSLCAFCSILFRRATRGRPRCTAHSSLMLTSMIGSLHHSADESRVVRLTSTKYCDVETSASELRQADSWQDLRLRAALVLRGKRWEARVHGMRRCGVRSTPNAPGLWYVSRFSGWKGIKYVHFRRPRHQLRRDEMRWWLSDNRTPRARISEHYTSHYLRAP
ncbi:hypothetical protein B0H21DRAFT_437263 [Amylocystis lapponica]|nr:hypothetical protein B0H21DRAFT_437263 [Amylocystis lapponica]